MSAPKPARSQQGASPPASSGSVRQVLREAYTREANRAAAVVPGARAVACPSHSGLGCGSPTAFAGLAPGNWVLDLGSGAGFDCLAAAVEVGSAGLVVGIDMTSEMVRLARRHSADAGVAVVHFLQGEMECLPFRDATFDVVISNCVFNLCPDKERVLAEACRVLKPKGRLAMADIVALGPLPAGMVGELALRAGCVSGATPLDALPAMLRAAGFVSVDIEIEEHSGPLIGAWAPDTGLGRLVAAANITAGKAV